MLWSDDEVPGFLPAPLHAAPWIGVPLLRGQPGNGDNQAQTDDVSVRY